MEEIPIISSPQPASCSEKHASDGEPVVQDAPLIWCLELFMAASFGDHQRLQQLLGPAMALMSEEADDGSAALVLTTEENSALHVVATDGDGRGYLESAKVIHGKAKQLLLARNSHGDTPLLCAARAGNTHMVSCLIDLAAGDGMARAMVGLRNEDGRTALHEAIGSDSMQMVDALMSQDKELARVVAYDGTSPLFLAISLGHHRIARRLHQYDNDLSYSGNHGQNALHAAVLHDKRMANEWLRVWTKDNKGKVKMLVEQRDDSGSMPVHVAASLKDPTLEFFLFAFVDRSLQVNSFNFYNDIAPSKLLYKYYAWRKHPMYILADADPSVAFQPDKNGLFPVHVAALVGSLVPIIILLWRCSPACARLRDSRGRTFLHIAVEKKRLNVVRFACNRSSEFMSIMNIQDKDGNTALHLAVSGGDWDIFRTLIWNRHVVLNLSNRDRETPMDIAEREAPSASGFNFGMHARRRILASLTFVNAQTGNSRRDHRDVVVEDKFEESHEEKKMASFPKIVGIGSVLVATATFAAAFAMPDKGKASHSYAFNGFVVSNTLAFICSVLATFCLIYTGVAALDIKKRIELVSFSLALLIGAARSFCAAFAFALYVEFNQVNHRATMVSCAITAAALLDVLWFMRAILIDATLILKRFKLENNTGRRSVVERLLRLGTRFAANIAYLFWPYIVIFSLLEYRRNTIATLHNKLG